MQYRSSWMTEELDVFRDQFRKFLAKDLAPHAERWRDQKMVDRSAWRALGEMGALLPSVATAISYDAFGNAISVTVSTDGGQGKTTTNTYTNEAASWRLGHLLRSTVQSVAP